MVELSRCAAEGKKLSVHGLSIGREVALTQRHASQPMKYTTYPSITQFQQHVELKDFGKPTQKEYVRYVRKLAEHFQCDPATLTEDQLRQYFLFLRQHKHYKAATMKGAKYSLLCFYVQHLQQKHWSVFREVRVVKPQVLPIVLSRSEVQLVLAAVREPRFRTCLTLMYHCGLRVGEAVRIEVKDIGEGAADSSRRSSPKAAARFICRGLWTESFPRRRGNGAGSMYFPRGIFQPIRVLASG